MNIPSPASFNYWQEAISNFQGINLDYALEGSGYEAEVDHILDEAESIPSGVLVGD